MATYFVIPQVAGASDSNNGTSKATPWLTIQKAATTAVAGDTVNVAGDWTYKELVTLAASGTSGSQISIIADVTGEKTGYGGVVLISSIDDPNDNTTTRTNCINLNGKEFVTIRGFTMVATGDCIYDNQLAGNRCYDGVIIEDCALISYSNWALRLDFNAGATPTSAGLIIRRIKAVGAFGFFHDNNATAHVNIGTLIENCEIYPLNPSSLYGGVYFSGASTNTYSVGGVIIANCVSWLSSTYGWAFNLFKNTTHVSKVINCRSSASGNYVANLSGTTAAVEAYNCVSMTASTSSGVTEVEQYNTIRLTDLVAGFADFPLYRFLGYSPFLPGEPMEITGWKSGSLGYGQSTAYLPTTDMYGNPRGMGRGYYWKGYFDASDDAVSDPNNVWTGDTSIADNSITTFAQCSTVGSSSSSYIGSGGTNAPSSGGAVTGVSVRIRAATSVSRIAGLAIYTDGGLETLLDTTYSLSTSAQYTAWTPLPTPPSGGWTWAKVQALEFKTWVTSGGSGTMNIYGVQVAVSSDSGHSDVGAVEARAQPVVQSAVTHYETYAAKFPSAGFQNDFAAVSAGIQTTISIWTRWDSNYSGSKPRLQVKNIPGVADQEAVATGSANTWEQLSVTFTPTADAYVLVRYESRDASTNGLCYFADETVAIS